MRAAGAPPRQLSAGEPPHKRGGLGPAPALEGRGKDLSRGAGLRRQKSEIRNQKAEIRKQKSERRRQNVEGRSTKRHFQFPVSDFYFLLSAFRSIDNRQSSIGNG